MWRIVDFVLFDGPKVLFADNNTEEVEPLD